MLKILAGPSDKGSPITVWSLADCSETKYECVFGRWSLWFSGSQAFSDAVKRSHPASKKAFTLVEIMIVVVIIGLLAAMAMPSFQKIRQASQDKAVLNNARQLSAAANQYFLETGATTVDSSLLLGPTNYVKSFSPVAGEVYPTTIQSNLAITVDGVGGLRTITYAP
jgi:type IV pilus assembly protein PilA